MSGPSEVGSEQPKHVELALAQRFEQRLVRRGSGLGVPEGCQQAADVGRRHPGSAVASSRAVIGAPSSTKMRT